MTIEVELNKMISFRKHGLKNKVKKESDSVLEEKDKTKEVKQEEPKESFERGLLEYNSGN